MNIREKLNDTLDLIETGNFQQASEELENIYEIILKHQLRLTNWEGSNYISQANNLRNSYMLYFTVQCLAQFYQRHSEINNQSINE